VVSSNTSLLPKWQECQVIGRNHFVVKIFVVKILCIITFFPSSLYWIQDIVCHPCLVQYWALINFSHYVGGANSITSLNMICRIPNNQIYSHLVTYDVCTTTKYLTPTSKVHNGFRSMGGIHHLSLWECLVTFK